MQAEYQKILERLDELEQRGVIGAFDKRTIIELSGDVIKEIARKYENVQKGRKMSSGHPFCADRSEAEKGDMMRGALIKLQNILSENGRCRTACRTSNSVKQG